MRLLATLVFLCSGTLWAGEYAVLASGARLRVDRHETDGVRVKLFTGAGYTEMPAANVTAFEAIEEPVSVEPPAPTAAVPAAPQAPVLAPSVFDLADAAADKYNLPPMLVRSVIWAESGYQQSAVSPRGAIGLMQLMPATAKELGVDPYDPAQNVDGGVRYLRDLLKRYDGGVFRALAAYNAGLGTVDKYQAVPPYRETINYVNRIDKFYGLGEAPPLPERRQ